MAAPTVAGTATTRGNALSTAIIGNAPAGIVAGELLVAHVRVVNASAVITDYGGFTLQDALRQGGLPGTSFIATKIATASEPATYTFTPDIAVVSAVAIQRVSGQHPTMATACEAANGVVGASTSTTIEIPAVTTLGADRLILWFVGAKGTAPTFAWTDATLNTNERYDVAYGSNRAMAGSWETQAAADSTGSEIVTLSVSGDALGHVLAVAPGGDTTPPAAPTGLTLDGEVTE